MMADTYTLTLQCARCGNIWDETFPTYVSARLTHKACPRCGLEGLPGGPLSPIRNLGHPRRPKWARSKGAAI